MEIVEYKFSQVSLSEALTDLAVRFVLNCPPEDLSSPERIFFQLEEALWFYIDFVRADNPSLPHVHLKAFVEMMYTAVPVMAEMCTSPQEALTNFNSYKNTIPVRGAIIINDSYDHILLVKGYHSRSWGFPKGKINKAEDDFVCAVREVEEEIGFDITPYANPKKYIDRTFQGKHTRLYVVTKVPTETHFETKTRMEISKIEWVPLSFVYDSKYRNSGRASRVSAFLGDLKPYLTKGRKQMVNSMNKQDARNTEIELMKMLKSDKLDTSEEAGGVDAEMDEASTEVNAESEEEVSGFKRILDTLRRETDQQQKRHNSLLVNMKKASINEDKSKAEEKGSPGSSFQSTDMLAQLYNRRKAKDVYYGSSFGRRSQNTSLLNILNSSKPRRNNKLLELLNPDGIPKPTVPAAEDLDSPADIKENKKRAKLMDLLQENESDTGIQHEASNDLEEAEKLQSNNSNSTESIAVTSSLHSNESNSGKEKNLSSAISGDSPKANNSNNRVGDTSAAKDASILFDEDRVPLSDSGLLSSKQKASKSKQNVKSKQTEQASEAKPKQSKRSLILTDLLDDGQSSKEENGLEEKKNGVKNDNVTDIKQTKENKGARQVKQAKVPKSKEAKENKMQKTESSKKNSKAVKEHDESNLSLAPTQSSDSLRTNSSKKQRSAGSKKPKAKASKNNKNTPKIDSPVNEDTKSNNSSSDVVSTVGAGAGAEAKAKAYTSTNTEAGSEQLDSANSQHDNGHVGVMKNDSSNDKPTLQDNIDLSTKTNESAKNSEEGTSVDSNHTKDNAKVTNASPSEDHKKQPKSKDRNLDIITSSASELAVSESNEMNVKKPKTGKHGIVNTLLSTVKRSSKSRKSKTNDAKESKQPSINESVKSSSAGEKSTHTNSDQAEKDMSEKDTKKPESKTKKSNLLQLLNEDSSSTSDANADALPLSEKQSSILVNTEKVRSKRNVLLDLINA